MSEYIAGFKYKIAEESYVGLFHVEEVPCIKGTSATFEKVNTQMTDLLYRQELQNMKGACSSLPPIPFFLQALLPHCRWVEVNPAGLV